MDGPIEQEITNPDSAHLNIVPLGAVDDMVLSVVAANLQAVLGLNTHIGPVQPIPEYAYQHVRRQYDALKIVRALAGQAGDVPLILGITRYDICTPILTFVFGESQLGGKAALISFHRIAGDEPAVTYARIVKIGLHEVGHLLGIGHCRTASCLMCFCANLEALDQLRPMFCDACMVEVSRRLNYLFKKSN